MTARVDLDELEALLAKATPGPWFWDVTPSGEVRLATPDRGRLYVMGFGRLGMQGAQPRFSLWGEGARERRGGIMHDFAEAGGRNHPDAELIANAPTYLAAMLTELRDLRARMERAPVAELTQVGWDDEDGKAFVMLCAPRDDGRAAATLLFKRVRLVVCDE